MAHRQIENSIHSRALTAAVVIGLTAVAAGCTVNPVFEHRFSSCMSYWNAQERVDATVYPEGYEKTDYCMEWARENLPGVAIAQSPAEPVPASNTEG